MAGLRTLFRSLFWQSRHVEAGSGQLAHLIKSLERNPRQDVKYIELLQAFESKGDLDSAIVYLTKFVKRKRNAETPYRFLLVAYHRKGDLAGLSNIIRLRPNYAAAHDWFLADAYIKRDWDAAIAVLSALVELHPNDERWSHSLATAYDNKGRREEPPPVPGSTTPHAGAAGKNKSEFKKNLELKQKFSEIETKDRERKRIEHALRSRPRPLTAWEKFRRIKPTGSRE